MPVEDYDIEDQGDLQYVVRLSDGEEDAEVWFRLTPSVLEQLGVGTDDAADLVAETVDFLRKHQEIPDFPDMVEIEDVLATYDDYEPTVTRRR